MHIEVLSGPDGPGRRPTEERELLVLLRELAARGVEARCADPEPPPVPEASERERPGGGSRVPERPSEAEALLLPDLGVDAPMTGTQLSRWLERARAAAAGGRPVVVSGLVLDAGTVREETAREHAVRGLLAVASLVGLQDEASLAVARRLCPAHPALCVGGEAALLLPRPAAPVRRSAPGGEREEREVRLQEEAGRQEDGPAAPARIVAVVHRSAGPFPPEETAPVLAALLDALVHRTGGPVTLAGCGGAAADAEFAAEVGALLRDDVRWEHGDAARADADVSGADYVLTTCARGAALGLAAGAVVLPVAPDRYAADRMDGVLSRWGLRDGVVPLASLLTPGGVAWDARAAVQQWATEAVEHRGAVRAALTDAEPALREAAARWWDAVAAALRGEEPPRVPGAGIPGRGVGAPVVRALRRRYIVPDVPHGRPTVAIVLRHCDRPVRLRRAVDDLLAQTFTDWRLVVVDCGGDPAGVEEVLASRRHELSGRGAVLRHRGVLGPAAAANRGLRAADSELVVLHDGTRRWDPTVLQRGVAHLEDPLVADDGVVVRTEDAPGRGREALTLPDVLDGDRAALDAPLLYRRAVHGVLGDYDETLGAAEDWEFTLRFLETFTAGMVPAHPVRAGRSTAAPEEPAVRDRLLRQWTSEHGIGLPLYLRRAAAEEAGALHRRLDAAEAISRELLDVVRAQSRQLERLERAAADRGFAAFWRRVWRSLRGG